jgi:hypothetical protein
VYRLGRSGTSLAHDPEKACPGLDPGLTDFSDKIMRKNMNMASKIASV